jgi:ribonuclease HI
MTKPMSDMATMHIDGAARGNPGPAAYAVVLARPGLPVVEEADAIGNATNNVAEYTALLEGLRLAAELGVKRLAVFSDSELMVKQMNGIYRVKNQELLELYREAKARSLQFEQLTLTHVRREHNKRADEIGNEALDGKPRKRGAAPELKEPDEDAPPRLEKSSAPAHNTVPGPSDARVREDALMILRSAAEAWGSGGIEALPIDAVWEQLWFLLEEGGLLKKPKKR